MYRSLVITAICNHVLKMGKVTLQPGFTAAQRKTAVALFWESFRGKLKPVMGPEAKAQKFLMRVADPEHAISACDANGTLLGIAGYKTEQGAFIGGEWSDLTAVYGMFGALCRAPLLSLLERDLASDVLLMDGIFVTQAARGQGVGTKLLNAIKGEAERRGLPHIRLDVIDTNPRARALYEREGFIAGETHHLGPLLHLFGFQSATTMIYTLP